MDFRPGAYVAFRRQVFGSWLSRTESGRSKSREEKLFGCFDLSASDDDAGNGEAVVLAAVVEMKMGRDHGMFVRDSDVVTTKGLGEIIVIR